MLSESFFDGNVMYVVQGVRDCRMITFRVWEICIMSTFSQLAYLIRSNMICP